MTRVNTESNIRLEVTRAFAAPRERVFRAWTDSKELNQWFAPSEDYSTIAEVDLRVGGTYRIAMKHRKKEITHVAVGTFREVRPPEKLVYTWSWEGEHDNIGDTVVTVEFRDLGGSTEIILTHEFFPNEKARDEHTKGWAGCLERLEKFLGSQVVRNSKSQIPNKF